MTSPWISALRSVALTVPDLAAAETFYTRVWQLEVAARTADTLYLRRTGDDHHLLALQAGGAGPPAPHATARPPPPLSRPGPGDAPPLLARQAGGAVPQVLHVTLRARDAAALEAIERAA